MIKKTALDVVKSRLRRTVMLEARISSDFVFVFTNGLSKEVKERTIWMLTSIGFLVEERLLRFVLIRCFLSEVNQRI